MTDAAAVCSTLMVPGLLAGHQTNMLVDTGSGVTIVREDVWMKSQQEVHDNLIPLFCSQWPGVGFAWPVQGAGECGRVV